MRRVRRDHASQVARTSGRILYKRPGLSSKSLWRSAGGSLLSCRGQGRGLVESISKEKGSGLTLHRASVACLITVSTKQVKQVLPLPTPIQPAGREPALPSQGHLQVTSTKWSVLAEDVLEAKRDLLWLGPWHRSFLGRPLLGTDCEKLLLLPQRLSPAVPEVLSSACPASTFKVRDTLLVAGKIHLAPQPLQALLGCNGASRAASGVKKASCLPKPNDPAQPHCVQVLGR